MWLTLYSGLPQTSYDGVFTTVNVYFTLDLLTTGLFEVGFPESFAALLPQIFRRRLNEKEVTVYVDDLNGLYFACLVLLLTLVMIFETDYHHRLWLICHSVFDDNLWLTSW